MEAVLEQVSTANTVIRKVRVRLEWGKDAGRSLGIDHESARLHSDTH